MLEASNKIEHAKEFFSISEELFYPNLLERLIESLKTASSAKPVFQEEPPFHEHFNYFHYKCECFIFEFPEYEEFARESLLLSLQNALKVARQSS